jgi:hypothetical protein
MSGAGESLGLVVMALGFSVRKRERERREKRAKETREAAVKLEKERDGSG